MHQGRTQKVMNFAGHNSSKMETCHNDQSWLLKVLAKTVACDLLTFPFFLHSETMRYKCDARIWLLSKHVILYDINCVYICKDSMVV